MPVTARLSQLFYERLGEQIATELVDWLNSVDATYRSDLRELNELNFARFDAKLEQRLSTLHAKLGVRIDAMMDRVTSERRFAELEARIDAMMDRVTAERRFAELEARIDAMMDRVTAERRFAELGARIELVEATLQTTLERGLKDQARWLFLAWASLLIPIMGLWMRG